MVLISKIYELALIPHFVIQAVGGCSEIEEYMYGSIKLKNY